MTGIAFSRLGETEKEQRLSWVGMAMDPGGALRLYHPVSGWIFVGFST